MRIILLQDIKSLGRAGDVKNVSDGYARNFLLPRNLAKPATPAAIQELDLQKTKIEKQLEELKRELEDIQKATVVEPLVFQVKAGERGEVFGSVGAVEIKERLLQEYSELKTADLKIEADHIKELGKQEIGVGLKVTPKSGFAASGRIEGKITIEVLPSTKTA